MNKGTERTTYIVHFSQVMTLEEHSRAQTIPLDVDVVDVVGVAMGERENAGGGGVNVMAITKELCHASHTHTLTHKHVIR